jgi:hypothetical protein
VQKQIAKKEEEPIFGQEDGCRIVELIELRNIGLEDGIIWNSGPVEYWKPGPQILDRTKTNIVQYRVVNY